MYKSSRIPTTRTDPRTNVEATQMNEQSFQTKDGQDPVPDLHAALDTHTASDLPAEEVLAVRLIV
jgi:hypothetical protein